MSPFAAFKNSRAHDLPWQVLRVAIVTVIIQWFFMIVVSVVECNLGPVSLLKPPGEPPWIRDQKMRGWTPSMIHLSTEELPEDYRLFGDPLRPHTIGTAFAHHRRLQGGDGDNGSEGVPDALGDLLKMLPSVGKLTEALENGQHGGVGTYATNFAPKPKPAAQLRDMSANFMGPKLVPEKITWPRFFEPQHLVCGSVAASGSAACAAITRRGLGAFTQFGAAQEMDATPFALDGAVGLGPLAGVSWTASGLQLVTKTGELLHCPGHTPTEGVWACEAVGGTRLPVPGVAQILSAALEEMDDGLSFAAVLEGFPHTVSIFKQGGDGKGWNAVGEMHLPHDDATRGESTRVHLALVKNELFATLGSGAVHRQHLHEGTRTFHPPPANTGPREYHAACALPDGNLVRLALTKADTDTGAPWVPELFKAL